LVAELLAALRATGAEVVYSSELVPPELKITEPLRATGAAERAVEALAVHGLELQRIAARQYIVTRGSPRPAHSLPAGGVTRALTATPERATPLDDVSVYVSRYSIVGSSIAESASLSSTQILQVPGSQHDALRATRALPALATNVSSRPYVRGSLANDVLVQFDGVPLADPFHFKNFQSMLSAFDAYAVDRIDIYSGGFPVRYGTRSGGVIDIAPHTLDAGYESSVGASLVAIDASSLGRNESLGLDWLVTAKRSMQETAITPLSAQDGDPWFMDSLGRVRWHPSATSAWTVGWLFLNDQLWLASDPRAEVATARYRDKHAWLAYEHESDSHVNSRTTLVAAESERTRFGQLHIRGVVMGRLDDRATFSRLELHSQWEYAPTPQTQWLYGAEGTHALADLKYRRWNDFSELTAVSFGRAADDSLVATATPQVSTYAMFGSVLRRWSAAQAELGARVDGQLYRGFAAREQFSPRLNVRYDLAAAWRLYGSWGRFTQAQRPEDWRVEEAQSVPDVPQVSIETILGAAYVPSATTRWRLEVYRKHFPRVNPYFDNSLNAVSLLPDLQPDRIRVAPVDSEAAGLELGARRSFTPSLEGWANYSWSRVADRFASGDVLRSWDQPHAVSAGLAWTSGHASASALVGWHTGWPRTPYAMVAGSAGLPEQFTVGARNSDRYGNYFTLDLRGSWTKDFGRSELLTWIDVTNSTNRPNACCVSFESPDRPSRLPEAYSVDWLPRTLNVGFSWRLRGGR
jgi:hypothetical protein